jgi:hypothetical protein
MGQYKVKTISLEKLLVGPMGVIEPLCNTCVTRDCDNPIQPMPVTVFGKTVNWKIFRKSNLASTVVSCTGYSRDYANL